MKGLELQAEKANKHLEDTLLPKETHEDEVESPKTPDKDESKSDASQDEDDSDDKLKDLKKRKGDKEQLPEKVEAPVEPVTDESKKDKWVCLITLLNFQFILRLTGRFASQ